MDDICRLCCSTTFVNNDIFDEENALYLKMSLYLPIKVQFVSKLVHFLCEILTSNINMIFVVVFRYSRMINYLRGSVTSVVAK